MSIQCPKCNTTNLNDAKFCKSCGNKLEAVTQKVEQQIVDSSSDSGSFAWIFWVLVVIGIVYLMNSSDNTTTSNTTSQKSVKNEEENRNKQWYATHASLSLPSTGVLAKQFTNGTSPLEIKTSYSNEHYFIKMINALNGNTVAKLFIRSGDKIELNIPSGSYEIKYATGEQWYGETDLFGPNTSYSQAGQTFDFSSGYGYTIELIMQVNGNLHTKSIDANSF